MADRWYVDGTSAEAVAQRPGLSRTTLAANDQLMMCLFEQGEGVEVPMHAHEAAQNGYVLSGRLRFTRGDGICAVTGPGDSYAFAPNEPHGSLCLERARFIESFAPARPEYR